MEEQLKRIQKQLDKLIEAVVGDPGDQQRKPGLIMRIDRVERGFLNIRWSFYIFCIGVIAPLTTAIVLRLI
jgi:hypothetical protein